MKLLLIGVILSFNISAKAVDGECKHCPKTLSNTPIKSLPEAFRKVANYKKLTPINSLADSLCRLYRFSKDVPTDAKEEISSFMIKNNKGKPTLPNMILFLNKNKDELHCETGKGRRNFIKEAITVAYHNPMINNFLIEKFLLDEEGSPMIDFNAVDIINGQPETVLDYLDSVLDGTAKIKLNANSREDLENLRFTLADEKDGFGANNFKDLHDEVKQKYLEKTH
jgi:hypothetical protein